MVSTAQLVIDAFEARYHSTPDLVRAPGRVNLIGEHTDYNLGFVLPIAVDLDCYVASAPNRRGTLAVYTANFDQSREWPIDRIPALGPVGDWSDYVVGVARQLPLGRGRDVLIRSEVPLGSGLSSSAALEVATALALGEFHSSLGGLPDIELVRLARRAENEFVGMPCGIMDQYASVFGQAGAALLIDCRSLESEPVKLPEGASIVAVNSMVKHELGQSAYAQRVAECAEAAAEMGTANLREATTEQLDSIHDPIARRRARHVLSENQRVLDFVAASRSGDLDTMGRLLLESHRSLQHDYEVSCEEIDFLVDSALEIQGVLGARITGGGFGGCTVNLVDTRVLDRFEETLGRVYRERFGIAAVFHRVRPSDGAQRLS